MPEWLKSSLATLAFAMVFFGVQAWIANNEPAPVEDCTPTDEGETTFQHIDNGRIICERHVRLDYGMAQLPVELQSPIRKAQ